MKVVAFSDIHGDLIKHVPECDIVLIAGDITPLDIQNSVEKSIAWFYMDFLPWAEALPCKKVLFIAGNHDYWLEQIGNRRGRSAKDIMKLLYRSKYSKDNKVIYLENSWYEFEGKKFYGFPWCPVLSNWSFYKSTEDMQKAVLTQDLSFHQYQPRHLHNPVQYQICHSNCLWNYKKIVRWKFQKVPD
jgi:predicted MPP superfamily phosphohydrolase